MNKTSNQSSLLLPSFHIQIVCVCEHLAIGKQVREAYEFM